MPSRVYFFNNIDHSNIEALLRMFLSSGISFASVPVTRELLEVIEKEIAGTTPRHLRRRIVYLENPSYSKNQEILDLLSANFGVLEYTSVSHSGELILEIDGRKYTGGRAILKAIQNEVLRIKHPSPVG